MRRKTDATVLHIDFFRLVVYKLLVASEIVKAGQTSVTQGDPLRSSSSPDASSRLSRRGLIQRLGAAGTASALGLVIPGNAETAGATMLNSIYEPTIQTIETDVMPVDRIGWSFNVDIDLLKRLTAANGSTELEILGSYERMSPRIHFSDQADGGSRKVVSDGKTVTLQVIPSLDNDYVVLAATQSKSGELIKASSPLVKLDYFTHTPDSPNDVRRVVSQTDLNHDLLRQLHERARLFDIFHVRTPVFIYRPVDGRPIASHDKSERYIKLPVSFFEDPDFEQLPFMIEDHEQFHGVFSPFNIRTIAERQAAIEAELAYNAAIHDIMRDLPEGTIVGEGLFPEKVKGHPLFQAFDESNYYPTFQGGEGEDSGFEVGEDGNNGHPYDNVNEFTASAANCISRVGEQVVENVDSIEDRTYKRDAVNMLRSVVKLVDAISSHPEVVDKNFPGFVHARKYIQKAA